MPISFQKSVLPLLQNLALFLVITIVCFALAEITIRIWKSNDLAPGLWPDENAQFIPELRKNLYPNITNLTRTTTEYRYHVSTNSQGFRDFHTIPKKPNTKRIAAVGASTLFGNTVEINETYISQLGTQLNVEIINLGLGANGFDEMNYILKEYGMQYQPDLILVEMELGTFYATYDFQTRSEKSIQKSLFLWTYEHSKLINFIYWKTKTTSLGYKIINTLGLNKNAQDGNTFDLALLQHQRNAAINSSIVHSYTNLKEMKQFANQNNIPLVVIFIPTAYQINPQKQDLLFEQYEVPLENIDLEVAQDLTHLLTTKLNIPLFDPTEQMKQTPNVETLNWPLDGHLTQTGAARYALLLSEFITEKKLLDESS